MGPVDAPSAGGFWSMQAAESGTCWIPRGEKQHAPQRTVPTPCEAKEAEMRLAAAPTLIAERPRWRAPRAPRRRTPASSTRRRRAARSPARSSILRRALVGAALTLRCGSFHQDARTIGNGTYSIAAPAGSCIPEAEALGFDPLRCGRRSPPSAGGARSHAEIGTFGSIITVSEPGGFVASSLDLRRPSRTRC